MLIIHVIETYISPFWDSDSDSMVTMWVVIDFGQQIDFLGSNCDCITISDSQLSDFNWWFIMFLIYLSNFKSGPTSFDRRESRSNLAKWSQINGRDYLMLIWWMCNLSRNRWSKLINACNCMLFHCCELRYVLLGYSLDMKLNWKLED